MATEESRRDPKHQIGMSLINVGYSFAIFLPKFIAIDCFPHYFVLLSPWLMAVCILLAALGGALSRCPFAAATRLFVGLTTGAAFALLLFCYEFFNASENALKIRALWLVGKSGVFGILSVLCARRLGRSAVLHGERA